LFTDADRVEAPTHVHNQDSGKFRPKRFLVPYRSRDLVHRKDRTSGRIRPQQESGPGFRPPTNRNKNRNVPPRPPSL
jgi:hypothetical protein